MSSAIRVARGDDGTVFVAASCGCAVKVAELETIVGRMAINLLDHAAAVERGDRSACVPLPYGLLGGCRD